MTEHKGIHWITAEMDILNRNFLGVIGRKPKGWIMGIQEYLALQHLIKKDMLFQDLPVIIKSSSGVELALDIDSAVQFSEIRKSRVNRYIKESLAWSAKK